MDFSKFDSRKAAETAKPLHLRHPATGALLYAKNKDGADDLDKPCRVLVIGTESRGAQAAIRAMQQAKMADEKKEADQSLDVLHKQLVDGALTVIKGFENIARGDRLATVDDAEWLLNLQLINGQDGEKSFVEQIMGFATKRANFLGNASAA